ncbi:conserved exported hypothetical protein [Candidatus Terasakiella magnetica]|uniref:Lipoprotein n=1 Tax=Candidatus Terasakiella magnetica TaxID=1867952 RepID=A0A1C3REB8_9PROT|nr:hypothetical protein [Candidatus Terasakiella magnetica]SCA55582.1 conserved exported hypothetical protein [Candidatus Terasakiella magnetica]
MKFAKFTLVASILCLGLTACDSMKIWRAEKPEPCPRVTVLKNAAELTKFKEGPGRDLIDVLFEAKVTNVLSQCYYDVDYDTRAGAITAQVAPVIAAKRGPADQSRSAELSYFIAVIDDNKKVLQKSTFPMKLAFPGNLTQNEVRDEPVDLTIVTNGATDGSNYEIYIGFQLSREEMAYNHRQTQR